MIPDGFDDVKRRLSDAIAAQGLGQYAAQLAAAAAPCICLLRAPDNVPVSLVDAVRQHDPSFAGDAQEAFLLWRRLVMRQLPLGASRVGGLPDLSPSIPWPTNRLGDKLHLAAQLDCSALPPIPGYPLPRSGWLYFFAEDSDREFPIPCAVFHYDGPRDSLVRAPESAEGEVAPSNRRRKLKPMYAITRAVPSFTLPCYEGDGADQLPDWSDDDERMDALDVISDDLGPFPQVARLFGLGGSHGMTGTALAQEVGNRTGDDWTVLLHIDFDNGAMGFTKWLGDNPLQIYIRHSDLLRGDFSNCFATV